ncbi:molybdopterin-dependent oxidoreductase [Paracoccus onubensis]
MMECDSRPGPVRTTCAYCGVGCGVLATPDGTGGAAIEGDPDHPANFGRLCVKGSALGETVGLEGRLLAPQIGGQETDWDQALDLVARRFAGTIAAHGPDSVAFYVSGQLLTEDYYVANKLMKGFIGSGNIDTNSRLCMASSVAGHRRAFGSDTVPGLYEDLEMADTVVLTGSNLAWCHPVLYQRLAAAKTARPSMRVVVIDPRRTATCDIADLHLAIEPGSDAALFNALLAEIDRRGLASARFRDHLAGADEAIAAARLSDPSMTGLDPAELARFLEIWLASEKVVTVYSQGINQSDSGTDKVNAIINCHLLTGRIGREGMGPFSVTGQPNAMGGREVGGLANMLACHLEIENPMHRDTVRDFWNSPHIAERPGLKAVDMFRAVEDGRIKALWIICTNPAVSMPDADRVARAIAGCDFTVVSDVMARTDTTRLADVLLPATGWGEKNGTVTNSERRISRQRPFLPAPGQARDDWRILAGVGRRMGWPDAFAWQHPAEIFAEYAALSEIAGTLGSDFDISACAAMTRAEYDRMAPILWPQSATRKGGRFFADGRFHTADGKARMLPIRPQLPEAIADGHLFRLNTGRVRDHWHTMTRTGKSPRLARHLAEPFLELHPDDAKRLNLQPADLARVANRHGTSVLRVLVTDRVKPGHPFAPIHWTGETGKAGRVGAVVPAAVDPVSGQPALKSAAVSIERYNPRWYGFMLTKNDLSPATSYWAKAVLPDGNQYELADDRSPDDWEEYVRELLNIDAQLITLHDRHRQIHRFAALHGGRLHALLFTGPQPVAVSRSHVAGLLGKMWEPADMAGIPPLDQPDTGPTICACAGVGSLTIERAIRSQQLSSLDEIGAALGAGANCGSCRSEIRVILERCAGEASALTDTGDNTRASRDLAEA